MAGHRHWPIFRLLILSAFPSRELEFYPISGRMRGLYTKDCVLSHSTLVVLEIEAERVGTYCLLVLIFIHFSPSRVPLARPWRLISHTAFERG